MTSFQHTPLSPMNLSRAVAVSDQAQQQTHRLAIAERSLISIEYTIDRFRQLIASEQAIFPDAIFEGLIHLFATADERLRESLLELENLCANLDNHSSNSSDHWVTILPSPTDPDHLSPTRQPEQEDSSIRGSDEILPQFRDSYDHTASPLPSPISSIQPHSTSDILDCRPQTETLPPPHTPFKNLPWRPRPPTGPWIIKGKWHMEEFTDPALSTIQSMFMHEEYQRGLNETGRALSTPSSADSAKTTLCAMLGMQRSSDTPVPLSDTSQRVNLYLMRSSALLACGKAGAGLEEADTAFHIAGERRIYYLMSKSQLYRGLCLMELERWKEASSAFTRAANVRGWASKVVELKGEAERKLDEAERRRGLEAEDMLGDLILAGKELNLDGC